jgi:hypothetical protein
MTTIRTTNHFRYSIVLPIYILIPEEQICVAEAETNLSHFCSQRSAWSEMTPQIETEDVVMLCTASSELRDTPGGGGRWVQSNGGMKIMKGKTKETWRKLECHYVHQ